MKDIITGFFTLRRGKWLHDRVREELAHYENVSRKRKTAGRKGGSASNGNNEENSQAIASQRPIKPEPEPEPDKLSEPKGSSSPGRTREERPAKAKSRRVPSEWFPTKADLLVADAEGLSPGEIERQLATMRDHQFRDAHSDWSAVFRNWMRRAASRQPSLINPQAQRPNHGRPDTNQSRQARFVERLSDIDRAMGEAVEQSSGRSGTGSYRG